MTYICMYNIIDLTEASTSSQGERYLSPLIILHPERIEEHQQHRGTNLCRMVHLESIDYIHVAKVLETWESARRTGKDGSFEKKFGKLLIDK